MADTARVVVGVDGSEGGRVALRWALAEATLRHLPLEVLHAWREPMVFIPGDYPAELVEMGQMREAALHLIDRELDEIGADGALDVAIDRSPVEGGAARALIEASAGAALVVVGRTGDRRFPRELIGPKVVQVAHHASAPVAVIPERWDGEGAGIVVGVDGSDHSSAALRWAAEEAQRRSAPLTAVMAWDLLDQHHAEGERAFQPGYGADQARDALRAELERAVPAHASGIAMVVENDLPARALLATAATAELLVVGARGLGGFRGLLLGSVSYRCLVHAPCPTVVVRGASA